MKTSSLLQCESPIQSEFEQGRAAPGADQEGRRIEAASIPSSPGGERARLPRAGADVARVLSEKVTGQDMVARWFVPARKRVMVSSRNCSSVRWGRCFVRRQQQHWRADRLYRAVERRSRISRRGSLSGGARIRFQLEGEAEGKRIGDRGVMGDGDVAAGGSGMSREMIDLEERADRRMRG